MKITYRVTVNRNQLKNCLRDVLREKIAEHVNNGNIEHINKSRARNQPGGYLIPSRWWTTDEKKLERGDRHGLLTEGKANMSFDMATGIINVELGFDVVTWPTNP